MTSNPIESESMPLVEGQTFVLFSDGVSEALDPEGEFFGEDACSRRSRPSPMRPPPKSCTSVMAAVRAFAAGARPIGRHHRRRRAVCADELMCVDNPGMPAVRAMKGADTPRR